MAAARRPDTFIVGAPKSGTTSLYDYLGGHPDVYMSVVKEPLYFCPDVGTLGKHRLAYPADEAAYLALFSGARDEARLGEATTRYLISREAPRLVHEFCPRPFIIAMLRNPVDMLYALHNERISQDHEEIDDFEQALAADDARYSGALRRRGTTPLTAGYRDSGRYADQLVRWFDAVGRERMHVIVFDDFVADTAAVFRRLLEFLEIEASFAPASLEARNTSHRQRRWVRRMLDSKLGDWATNSALPAVIGGNTKARLARSFRHSRLNRRPAPRPPLAAGLRAQLEHEFTPQVEALSELLGRDMVALWFGSAARPAK